jgi:hypothetical protein
MKLKLIKVKVIKTNEIEEWQRKGKRNKKQG